MFCAITMTGELRQGVYRRKKTDAAYAAGICEAVTRPEHALCDGKEREPARA
jgi:hypothetical protein